MQNISRLLDPAPRYKRDRTKLFNVCKALDYTMSMHPGDNLFTVYDVSGNYMGCMTAEAWLDTIKRAIRSAPRC